jgi:hypothetical protein
LTLRTPLMTSGWWWATAACSGLLGRATAGRLAGRVLGAGMGPAWRGPGHGAAGCLPLPLPETPRMHGNALSEGLVPPCVGFLWCQRLLLLAGGSPRKLRRRFFFASRGGSLSCERWCEPGHLKAGRPPGPCTYSQSSIPISTPAIWTQSPVTRNPRPLARNDDHRPRFRGSGATVQW